jgi:hypothetical protein
MSNYNFISVIAPNNPFVEELYLVTDVEANGPSPLTASMLSTGIIAVDRQGRIHGVFYANLKPRTDVGQNASTMTFWKQFPKAFAQTTYDPLDPAEAMLKLKLWVHSLQQKTTDAEGQEKTTMTKVVVDCGFDWMYMQSYVCKYLDDELIIGYDCIHSDTFNWAHMTLAKDIKNSLYDNTTQSSYKAEKYPHTHVAVADALCDTIAWVNQLRENQKLEPLKDLTYDAEIATVLAQITAEPSCSSK